MHPEVGDWVERCIAAHGPFAHVLEIGGRDINGSVRPLFGTRCTYTVVDIVAAPEVDFVGDAVALAREGLLPTGVDCVVSTEALEHYPAPADVVDAAHELLRPGGVFIATMAGPGRHPHSGLVEGPPQPGEHYRNIDPDELTAWLEQTGFGDFLVDVHGLDLRCWATR